MLPPPVNPETFSCIESGNIDELHKLTPEDLRPFLPMLVRTSLILAGDLRGRPVEFRQKILVSLSDIEQVNYIVALLSVDFQTLEVDVKKELQLRQKQGNRDQDSVLVQSLPHGLALEFERSDATRRLRLVLSELLLTISQMHEPRQDYYMKSSPLFDDLVYLEDVADTISIALAELPNLLSLCDVCEAMLHVKHGSWIITRLVTNMPDTLMEVCFHLISNGDKWEEETEGGFLRLEALKLLSQMSPRMNLLIRSRCLELNRMPALSVFLSLGTDLENDLIPFLSGILLGNDQQVRNWFSSYIRNSQKKKIEATSSLSCMRNAIWSYIQKFTNNSRKILEESNVVQASSLLRLLCALKGIAGFKFTDEEVADMISLITLKAPSSAPGHRYVTLGICSLLACPSLLSTPEFERPIIEWIKSLIQDVSQMSTGGGNSSFGDILLLIAIHFHSNQLSAISELVCTTLGMKIPIRVNSMTRIKQIFTMEIFTEQVVTAHAIRVPVTGKLSANINGFLPVHCMYQLIKSRAFTKHRVPIKDWIYRQVRASELPIHPVLPALLEVYVQSILGASGGTGPKSLEVYNEPLTDDECLKVFEHVEDNYLASQLLVLYYLLLYEDYRLVNLKNLLMVGRKVKTYSGKVFSQVPIKFLLQEAQKGQHLCGGLFPPLLRLLTTHFPQLCIVTEWIEEINEMLSVVEKDPDKEIAHEDIEEGFKDIDEYPWKIILLLEDCKKLSPYNLWSVGKGLVNNIKVIMSRSVPRKIQDLYREVWFLLNNIYPRYLWEMTTNALMPEKSVYLTADDLATDPLQILRCDGEVFRCAPVLSIVLHILAASVQASKYFLSKHLQEKPATATAPGCSMPEFERDELKNALVALQDSAAVQILLEACLPKQDEKGIQSDIDRTEVQKMICSFLHQLFMVDVNLVKLVHFQGYPLDLIPITVRGIPSMHICVDFIPELLQQPEMDKQVFAIQLISHLSIQYSLPKSFAIAKLTLATMTAMCVGVMSADRAEYFLSSLSALPRLCTAFPPLMDDSICLLMQLGKICTAQNTTERNRMHKSVRNKTLLATIYETYDSIIDQALMERKVF